MSFLVLNGIDMFNYSIISIRTKMYTMKMTVILFIRYQGSPNTYELEM